MITFAHAEQEIKNQLLIRHNLVLVDGSIGNIAIGLDMADERTNGSDWRNSHRNGKVRINVGDMTNRKVGFRELKNGGFNYDKIADKLFDKYNEIRMERKIRTKTEDDIKNYDTMIIRAAEKHGMSEYSSPLSIKHNRHFNRVLGIQLKLNVTTNEQIDALLELAKELGINIS